MHSRKLVRDSIGFTASQYLVRFLTTVRGLVAARLLGPAGYGAWNALMLIMDYGIHAPLGTYSGLDRTVPARLVDGDAVRLAQVERAGLFNVLVTTGLFVVLCTLYFARSTGQIGRAWGLSGVVVMLACLSLTALSYYHLTLLRSRGNITAVSLWYLLQGTIGVGLGLGLIPSLGVWGLLWGWFAGTLVAAVRPAHATAVLAALDAAEIAAAEVGEVMAGSGRLWLTDASGSVRTIDAPEPDPYWSAYHRAVREGWA